MKKTRYPNYDVLSQQEEWDGHTRSIVKSRTEAGEPYRFLTLTEAEMLRAICSIMAGDGRANIIQFVLRHIDQSLSGAAGESQRKASVPKAQELLREGLKQLDQLCLTRSLKPFIELPEQEQFPIVSDLSEGKLPFPPEWNSHQKALFNRILSWTVESYYSHPTVWSEIGYGGPAYPRGYVRTNIGQLDPWEAKTDT